MDKLIKRLIAYDWGDDQYLIKSLVQKYLREVDDKDLFVVIYNTFQDKIQDTSKIFYYLNPLKFPGNEQLAMQEIRLDPKLDYTGFIVACENSKIDSEPFRSRL